jgi:hypothetical protein
MSDFDTIVRVFHPKLYHGGQLTIQSFSSSQNMTICFICEKYQWLIRFFTCETDSCRTCDTLWRAIPAIETVSRCVLCGIFMYLIMFQTWKSTSNAAPSATISSARASCGNTREFCQGITGRFYMLYKALSLVLEQVS